ncbi:MAG: hypothetical protein AABX88_02815 [Nanoarchaeota archaeon]
MKPKYEIQNIIATFQINEFVNFKKIAKLYDNYEYNPEKHPSLVMRIDNPKSSAILGPSGKVVVTGTKSINDLEKAIEIIKEKVLLKK